MESKQRNGGTGSSNRRRRARMQKRQQRAAAEEVSENEESPPVRQKRPPQRKKRIKEPLYQEDIVDGFAFLCFKTYEDLEVGPSDHPSTPPSLRPPLNITPLKKSRSNTMLYLLLMQSKYLSKTVDECFV